MATTPKPMRTAVDRAPLESDDWPVGDRASRGLDFEWRYRIAVYMVVPPNGSGVLTIHRKEGAWPVAEDRRPVLV